MNMLVKALAQLQREVRVHRIQRALADPTRSPTILCASIGRVGSNMLHHSVIEGRARAITGTFQPLDTALIGGVAWDLGDDAIRPGSVTKTHDLPYALKPPEDVRVVFSFGRPSDTILSVLHKSAIAGDDWRDRHLRNMHATGPLDEILERDILRIEEQIDAWRVVTGVPIFAIHYDALWDATDLLGGFLGFPVSLPPRRQRGSEQMDPSLVAKVRQTYARLDDIVEKLPAHWQSDGRVLSD